MVHPPVLSNTGDSQVTKGTNSYRASFSATRRDKEEARQPASPSRGTSREDRTLRASHLNCTEIEANVAKIAEDEVQYRLILRTLKYNNA